MPTPVPKLGQVSPSARRVTGEEHERERTQVAPKGSLCRPKRSVSRSQKGDSPAAGSDNMPALEVMFSQSTPSLSSWNPKESSLGRTEEEGQER